MGKSKDGSFLEPFFQDLTKLKLVYGKVPGKLRRSPPDVTLFLPSIITSSFSINVVDCT